MARKKKEVYKVMDTVDEVRAVAEEKQASVPSEEARDCLRKVLKDYRTRILSTSMLKEEKIPSSPVCAQHGYILVYLMLDHWLLTTIDYVKGNDTFD